MKVLVLADVDKRIETEFPDLEFSYMGYSEDAHIPLTKNEIMNVISEYDFLISEFDTIDKDVLNKAERLRLIICCRGGVHTVIDVPYATKKGIIVKNTPARNASSVAEYVLGVIFNADRNLIIANELVHSETLQKREYYLPDQYRDSLWGMDKYAPYHILRGKGMHNITLGIIGYGNVGRVVANAAVLLGMKVLIYTRHPVVSPVPAGAEMVDFDELLYKSDYVSLHCNNRAHEVVMGEKEFKKMKTDGYFINTARGDLVDENALIDALNMGSIRGAALDVTRKEPLPVGSPLIKAKNIFITPHIAGAADEVIQIGTDMAIYHLREFLSDMWEEQ